MLNTLSLKSVRLTPLKWLKVGGVALKTIYMKIYQWYCIYADMSYLRLECAYLQRHCQIFFHSESQRHGLFTQINLILHDSNILYHIDLSQFWQYTRTIVSSNTVCGNVVQRPSSEWPFCIMLCRERLICASARVCVWEAVTIIFWFKSKFDSKTNSEGAL